MTRRKDGTTGSTRRALDGDAAWFAEKMDRSGGPTACWKWNASVSHFGYGKVFCDGRIRAAHRVAWEMHHGRPVPRGMNVCHSCDTPPCCNPAHLWLGTKAENTADMTRKGRDGGRFQPKARRDFELLG